WGGGSPSVRCSSSRAVRSSAQLADEEDDDERRGGRGDPECVPEDACEEEDRDEDADLRPDAAVPAALPVREPLVDAPVDLLLDPLEEPRDELRVVRRPELPARREGRLELPVHVGIHGRTMAHAAVQDLLSSGLDFLSVPPE